MADNAIYTPTPKTISVTVYRDYRGEVLASSGPAHLVATRGEVIGTEDALVVARGNLHGDNERWFQVELADGSRHSVLSEGS